MIYKIVSIALLLTNCASLPKTIEPETVRYYDSFYKDTGYNPYNIPIRLGSINHPSHIAYCENYKLTPYGPIIKRAIVIDRSFWTRLPEGDCREQLIYHELGHCVFKLDHNENWTQMNQEMIPESIMFPATFGCFYFYKKYKQYYIKELVDQYK